MICTKICLCIDADIVCSRAKNHYDPLGTVDFSDTNTQMDSSQADASLESFKRGFLSLHPTQSRLMYFSACISCYIPHSE